MSPYLIPQTVGRAKPNWVHLLSLQKSIRQRNEKVCRGVKSACRRTQSADSKSKKDGIMLPQLPSRQPFQSAKLKECEIPASANAELAQRLCFRRNAVSFERHAVRWKRGERSALVSVEAEQHNVIVSSAAPISL